MAYTATGPVMTGKQILIVEDEKPIRDMIAFGLRRAGFTVSEGELSPAIDTVFLAGPISYPGLLIQAVGRALRRHEGKTEVAVHDYLDASVPVLNAQYSRRRSAYRQMGFTD